MSGYLKCNEDGRFSWSGKHIRVEILHSRAGLAQQIWLECADEAILVDCGDGCLRDILKLGLDIDMLKGILFTHSHFDHVGGLHPLLGFLRMINRQTNLIVGEPKKCAEVEVIVKSFTDVYGGTMPFKIEIKSFKDNDEIKLGEMAVNAREMTHSGSLVNGVILDPIPALGYRVSFANETVAITGDTGLNDSVRELVRDADLAIIEATFKSSELVSKEIIKQVHLSEDIACELGKLARNYVLVHKGKR